jgi:negative regulator of flagellin synthesis FlgM
VENINKSAEVKDNVKISTKGKDFAVAQKALKEIPDVRKEKVEEISKKIESKSYSVKGEDIVNKLFDTGVNIQG